MMEAERLADLAVEVAEAAGDLLLGYATAEDLDVDTKTSATDPVSEADRAAERLITTRILEARPDDGIVGEEDADNRAGSSGLVWVVDPLDGTVNFLYGIPAWCVSVACEDAEGAVAAAVHDPSRGETFRASRGGGATLNGRPVRTSAVDRLDRALVATGFSYGPDVRAAQGRWAAEILSEVRDLRRVGAAALDLAWTACGRYDGFYEFGLNHWDYAAGVLLVREAGGAAAAVPASAGGRADEVLVAGGPAVQPLLEAWVAARVRSSR